MTIVPNIFGVMEPIFGGARLPNHQTAFQKPTISAALTCDRKRRARRAVGPACATFAGPSFSIVARHSGSSAEQPLFQRLGARFDFDQIQGPDKSWVSGKLGGRSGASPHQHLMTKIKIFVPYFISPIVSL